MKKTLQLLTALAMAVAVASAAVPATPVLAATPAPRPVVQGNRLVDSRTGETFSPRGVNIPGLEYSCVQGWRKLPATGEFSALASWKINTVRLPLNESCWLGLDGAPSGSTVAQYKADVKAWVDGANAVGLAVILDLHWNAPAGYTASGQRPMPDERSAAFWTSVATAYASNTSVMFELFNEPYSRLGFTLTWGCWKNGGCLAPVENDETGTLSGATYTVTGMQTLVSAVRSAGANQPLLLGGLNYSNDLTGWIANKPADPAGQLVAAWHNYPGQGCSTSCWDSTIATVAASIPIVTTEFGNTAETTSTAVGDPGNYLVPFMTWAEAHGIGYLPWAWWDVSGTTGNGVYALYSGSSFTPKSPSGTKFHSHLARLAPPAPTALTPATLVKSPSASTVYLVDGSTNLVPLAAFSTASDAGLGTSYSVVSQSLIDGYSISASPLRNVIHCEDTDFVAGDGRLWPVASSLVVGLPRTTLSASTCTAFPRASSTIQGALFVTPLSGGTIYSVSESGTKRPIVTMDTLGSLSAPHAPIYVHVGSQFLNEMPTGAAVLPPGRLVKSSGSPTVYLADGTARLVPLTSFANATDAGISTTYLTLSATDISAATVAAEPLRNTLICDGSTYFAGSGSLWPVTGSAVSGLDSTSLSATTCATMPHASQSISTLFVKGSGVTIYALQSGAKRPVLTMATISALAAPGFGTWLSVGEPFLSSLPTGAEVVIPGMLVKSTAAPTVYVASDMTGLVPVRDFASISDLGLSTSWAAVAPSTVSGMTVAGAVMSNLIVCDGQVSLASGGGIRAIPAGVAGSLPATSPGADLCRLLVTSPPRTGAVLIKGHASPTIYQLVDGVKMPIGSWGTVVELMAGGPVVYFPVSDQWVSSVPSGAVIP